MINSTALPVPLTPSYRRVDHNAPQHFSRREFPDAVARLS